MKMTEEDGVYYISPRPVGIAGWARASKLVLGWAITSARSPYPSARRRHVREIILKGISIGIVVGVLVGLGVTIVLSH